MKIQPCRGSLSDPPPWIGFCRTIYHECSALTVGYGSRYPGPGWHPVSADYLLVAGAEHGISIRRTIEHAFSRIYGPLSDASPKPMAKHH
jgi:hypothetical protein